MKCEPECKSEDDSGDRCTDSGEGMADRGVVPETFNIGGAQEDEHEARNEGHPDREDGAEETGDEGWKVPG